MVFLNQISIFEINGFQWISCHHRVTNSCHEIDENALQTQEVAGRSRLGTIVPRNAR